MCLRAEITFADTVMWAGAISFMQFYFAFEFEFAFEFKFTYTWKQAFKNARTRFGQKPNSTEIRKI